MNVMFSKVFSRVFSNGLAEPAAVATGIATAGILAVTPAFADSGVIPFGHTAELAGAGGAEITDYTVSKLQASGHNDGVWFSEVIVRANRGPVTPVIGDFNARAANGATYSVLEGTRADELSNQPIDPGGQRSGRLYFQVGSGIPPDSVVYSPGRGANSVTWRG